MDLYKFSFGVLTLANGALGYLQYRTSQHEEEAKSVSSRPKDENSTYRTDDEKRPIVSTADEDAVAEFQKSFFCVYGAVVAADWLQGPYMYALYKDEKSLSERTTAILFASGFVSAAISASYVGAWADINGRKQACLGFCVAYAISCMTMMSSSVPILFFGRILGGISTTLMYSVFETWMVHEFHAREMGAKGMQLSKIFGTMTTMSGVVAVLAGVIGEALVDWSGTKVAPFMAALVCLGTAFALISNLWPENFGKQTDTKETGIGNGTDVATILKDKRVVCLGLVCCLFEGSMYLFVFFWSAAMKSARSTIHSPDSPPPFGLVFATFMSAMMFGSQLFTIFSSASSSSNQQKLMTVASSVQQLSFTVLLAAASLLAIVTFSRREELTLWGFCVFEACVGMYYPSMGYLKGQIVQDGIRGKVYGLLRLPLNIFVVIALALTREGDRYRGSVFMTCSALLMGAYLAIQKYLAS